MTYPIDELNVRMRSVMSSFGKAITARRPDVRPSVEQFPNIHYASVTLVDFLWDQSADDLVVASAILDTRDSAPKWMIDITTGDGMRVADLALSERSAREMALDPALAAKEVDSFLNEHLSEVLDALPPRDIGAG